MSVAYSGGPPPWVAASPPGLTAHGPETTPWSRPASLTRPHDPGRSGVTHSATDHSRRLGADRKSSSTWPWA